MGSLSWKNCVIQYFPFGASATYIYKLTHAIGHDVDIPKSLKANRQYNSVINVKACIYLRLSSVYHTDAIDTSMYKWLRIFTPLASYLFILSCPS